MRNFYALRITHCVNNINASLQVPIMVIQTYTQNENKIAYNITSLPKHILVGYWHNWQDLSVPFIRLAHISPKFNVINIAFALPDEKTVGQMRFHLYKGTTPEQFKADIALLHSLGKKVLISVGGANGSLALTDKAAQAHFVESMTSILEEYDFDGIDINLEGKIALDKGDRDFRNPTSPAITHLIAAVQEIRTWFGPNFILSMAPETIGVQGGYATYSGLSGAYLPIIHGLREIISYVHVQHYHSGPMLALDGKYYEQGTADFHVAMAEILLQGFSVKQYVSATFAGLKPEQVVIGLPAFTHSLSSGYTTPAEIEKAIRYLTTGQSFDGEYQLQEPDGYPSFRGMMIWSINWDATRCQEFSGTLRAALDSINR